MPKNPLKIVFTDASMRMHLGKKYIKPYGTGYLILNDDDTTVTGSMAHSTADLRKYTKNTQQKETINTTLSELMAMKDLIQSDDIKPHDQLIIYTDSMVAQSAYHGLLHKKSTANYHKLLQALNKEIKNKQLNVTVRWIPSHSHIWGNDTADILAGKASANAALLMGIITTQMCLKLRIHGKNKIYNPEK